MANASKVMQEVPQMPRASVSADNIVVSDDAFRFLVLQKGKLADLHADRAAWLAAYREGLNSNYAAIRAYLPRKPGQGVGQIVDIGSGLGGIDILLYRHYAGQIVPVLIDGVKDLPVMKLHRETFNDMDVAARFLSDNGVVPMSYVDPKEKPLRPLSQPAFLIVSFGSWCFHYAPELYLDWALANSVKGATFIFDVRKDKPEWRRKLESALKLRAVVHGNAKLDRCVFNAL